MNKKEKIELLSRLMTRSKRADETEFYHFTDEAPRELTDLYLEHYNVRDIDYETFSVACDLLSEIYEGEDKASSLVEDEIYESASDNASMYTAERLSYLNVWNEDDITGIVRECGVSIQEACAIWYDRQVEQGARILQEWVESK